MLARATAVIRAAGTALRDSSRVVQREAGGPVLTATWLGLTFGLLLGLALAGRSHPGVRAAGVTLLIELVPLTVAVFGVGLSRGMGSFRAAVSTGAALTFVLLRLAL